MSIRAERIKERYQLGYVTDDQLKRYEQLGVITQEEYEEIYAMKHPAIGE